MPADTQSPVTSASFIGPAQTTLGFTILRAGTSIQLTAVDQPTSSYSVGVDSTYFLMDVDPATCTGGPQTSIPDFSQASGTCANPLYPGPIVPTTGKHTIYFFSIDRAGNAEAPKSLTFEVGAVALPGASGSGGLGIGLDASHLLWSVATDTSSVSLAHNDANGVFTGSTTLSGADPAIPWSVFFDSSGAAYAVGAALAGNGADQLAVYRASPSGSAIVSAQNFDSGFNNNNLVFSAVAPGWIVGSVQTQGPISLSQSGARSYSMAVWNFNPATGLIQLTTTYSRAGFDVATGVSLDSVGNLWIAGFSQSPNPRSPRVFDLALWKYASDGKTLLGGPYIREAYLSNFDTTELAELVVSSGSVYVAAPHERGAGGTDMALAVFRADGTLGSESAWRPADASNAFASAILPDSSGNLISIGGFDYGAETTAGLWRYSAAGTLNAVLQPSAGGARGAVFNGSNLWLTVDGSTNPYLDTPANDASASGAFADILPPRTSVVTSTPSYQGAILFAGVGSSFSVTAVDDKLVVGDGAGTGVFQIYASTDGVNFGVAQSSFALSEGTHTVYSYALDQEANASVIVSTVVAVDLTAPTASLTALSSNTFAITAIDPLVNGAASGVGQIHYLVDSNPQNCGDVHIATAPPGTCSNINYAGPFVLAAGTHTVYFQALDNVGNGQDVVISSAVTVGSPDNTPPVTTLNVSTLSFISVAGAISISTRTSLSLSAVDPSSGSGVAATFYAVDAATPTSAYTAPFSLAAGTHTLVYRSIDNAGNLEAINSTSLTIYDGPFVGTTTPSSAPIGASALIVGLNFSAYNGTKDRVYMGASTAAVVSWNASTITFSVPTLAAGVYPLTLAVLQNGTTVPVSAGSFTVVAPQLFDVVPDSGPIGAILTLDGAAFGAYGGARTQVLIGASTAPVNSWTDAKIKATVPGALAPGDYPILARRIALDGGVSASNALSFHVDSLNLTGVSPSTGPTGVSFAISGSGFGSAAGNLTQILFGGTTAQVSSWTDTKVVGVVPALSTGTYDLSLLRIQGTGVAASAVTSFTVTALTISAPSPAAAPLGELVTISGTGFGAYGGTKTRLLIGGSTVPVTSWTDSTIKGRVPTLADGPQALWIERLSGAGLESSNTVYLQVVEPTIAAVTPSSGPIGGIVILTGSGFGTLNGSSTTVLFGGTTAPITLWNDATVQITVPGDAALGTASVQLRRVALDGGIVLSNAVSYGVAALAVGAVSPSSAPIGAPFIVTGSGFGAYAGTTNTQVLIGGATAAITAWSDATIKGALPFLSTGTYGVVVQRRQGGFAEQSAVSSITIVLPTVYALSPSSGPIGAPFTISGLTFGPSGGANTKVLFGGSTATVTSWTDSLVKGTVPGWASTGTYELTVERDAAGGSVQVDAGPFLVVAPVISTIAPNFGNAGTVVTVRGAGFGPAAGASTRLYVGASTVAYSVWNDQTIKWTVPASLANGLYAVTVVRAPAGGTATSNAMNYTVGSIALGAFAAARATPLAALPDQNFEGGMNLLASDGGTVQSASLAGVTVPAGALSDDAVVTVGRDRDTAASARADALGAAKLSAAGEPIAFGPEGTQFSAPATISLPYDPNLVPAGALSSLSVGYYDPIAKTWTPLTSQVDAVNHVVTAQTAHFSLYQALVPAGLLGTPAQDAWGLRAAYAFPNPVRGTSAVTIRIQPGLADSVEVHVYDKSGRRVHASSNFALSVTDDGNGLGAQDTYDHAWDISGVGSGVYDFVITAKRSGQSDIHKTGKIGVIK